MNSVCSDCLIYLPDPLQKQSCLNRLAGQKMSSVVKSSCFGCQNWYNTPEGRSKCVMCLGTPQSDAPSFDCHPAVEQHGKDLQFGSWDELLLGWDRELLCML